MTGIEILISIVIGAVFGCLSALGIYIIKGW